MSAAVPAPVSGLQVHGKRATTPLAQQTAEAEREHCPICGVDALEELKCKVLCRNCRTIVKSCADL